ncbi:MAG: undecaprenyl-diphosphate phosphatase [Oscillospiraceae bacterium]
MPFLRRPGIGESGCRRKRGCTAVWPSCCSWGPSHNSRPSASDPGRPAEDAPGVAVFLALNGLLLFLTDRVGHGKRDVRSATVTDSLCMGLAQALSVVPGLSARDSPWPQGFAGPEPGIFLKFSFLMAAPAMLLQSVVALLGALRSGASFCAPYLAGMAWRVVRLSGTADSAVCIRRKGLELCLRLLGHGPFDLHFILNLLRREATWHRRNLHPTLGPKKGKSLTPPRNGP